MCSVATEPEAGTSTAGPDLLALPVDRHQCPTCGATVPLQNVSDKIVVRRVSRERRRVLRLDCDACGNAAVVRFRLVFGRAWQPIGSVMVIPPARHAPPAEAIRLALDPRPRRLGAAAEPPGPVITTTRRRRRAG